jgi:DNA helicase-2/ATP-dependent DNA helicase PcrA
MTPYITEQEINYLDNAHIITARIDAVFEVNGEYEIVDWKTGKIPQKHKLANRAIQLATYRKAWLMLNPEINPEKVRATFAFIANGEIVEFNAHELEILYAKMTNSLKYRPQ